MCGTWKSIQDAYTGVRNGIFGDPPDKGAEERKAKSDAKAQVDAANTEAANITNSKLADRNRRRALSVLSTGAGAAAPGSKATLGQ